MPARSVSCAISGENGALSSSRIVSGSATSTLSICDSSALRLEASIVMCRSSVNFTASASNGSPSWNFTFGRSLIVTVLPSCEVSCESASCGTMLRLPSMSNSLSHSDGEHDAPDIRARDGRIEIVGILGKADAQMALRERRRGGDRRGESVASSAMRAFTANPPMLSGGSQAYRGWARIAACVCQLPFFSAATAAAMPASITSRSSVPCGFCRDGMNFT